MATCQEEVRRVGADQVTIVKGGAGRPLLVLHEELGHPGWLNWHQALSSERELLVPLHPGFGRTPLAGWVSNMRDLACFYARLVRELRLAPVDVIGFSLGGWLAAEMAANDAAQFRRMVLVAPTGIRPPEGEIMDMFTVTSRNYIWASVLDPATTPEFAKLYDGQITPEQFEALEDARAETARLAWAPYMFNPSLPRLLEGIAAPPTLIIWGQQDAIVPAATGRLWRQAVAGSRLEVFEKCGHRPEIERADRFISIVKDFVS